MRKKKLVRKSVIDKGSFHVRNDSIVPRRSRLAVQVRTHFQCEARDPSRKQEGEN